MQVLLFLVVQVLQQEKMAALEAAGVTVVVSPADIGKAIAKVMAKL